MSLAKDNEPQRFEASNRAEWRAWLEKNHALASSVWLVYYKKHTGKASISYNEAVEEALCFGWIDSRPNTLDQDRYMQLFSPRKARSPWSKLNKQRVEKLIEQGLMMPAGFKVVEASKQDGSWNSYDAIEELALPPDFQQALAGNEEARKNFAAFSNSSKKPLLWHIESAKRPETRSKRIEKIVLAAQQNKNPLQYNAREQSTDTKNDK
jgi:uncharacterized protein YdeI (YjbR/CyaY-like superfamily)